MIALFKFIGLLICNLAYLTYKHISNKKYNEKVQYVASVEEEMLITSDERDEFVLDCEDALEDVSDEMASMFGDNWKERFNWYNPGFFSSITKRNIMVGWDAVAILYFAKRGKLVSNSYKVIPKWRNENITFFKYIESIIQKKHPNMKMIFVHDMIPDLHEQGKWHVNKSGSGDLTWEYYCKNFQNKYAITEYLW